MYCLESPDLPPGVRVQDVAVPRRRQAHAAVRRNLLGGVTVLETEAVATRAGDGTASSTVHSTKRKLDENSAAVHPLLRLVEPRRVGNVGLAANEVS